MYSAKEKLILSLGDNMMVDHTTQHNSRWITTEMLVFVAFWPSSLRNSLLLSGISMVLFLSAVSLAVHQRVTVMKGQTLFLSCPITNPLRNHVEWRNPDGSLMFFGNESGKYSMYLTPVSAVTHALRFSNFKSFVLLLRSFSVLRDKRYRIVTLSESEFTVSVSDITFKDGGNYTCSQYRHPVMERKVEVTVFGEYLLAIMTIILSKSGTLFPFEFLNDEII